MSSVTFSSAADSDVETPGMVEVEVSPRTLVVVWKDLCVAVSGELAFGLVGAGCGDVDCSTTIVWPDIDSLSES
jgi:hypothetical protein